MLDRLTLMLDGLELDRLTLDELELLSDGSTLVLDRLTLMLDRLMLDGLELILHGSSLISDEWLILNKFSLSTMYFLLSPPVYCYN
jgi:hypothetical protein